MSSPAQVARTLRIFGRVQGVAYRAWMVRIANELGVGGWVRNCVDGSVEALIVGPPEAVEAITEACLSGPPAARVERLEMAEEPAVPPVSSFRQRPTF